MSIIENDETVYDDGKHRERTSISEKIKLTNELKEIEKLRNNNDPVSIDRWLFIELHAYFYNRRFEDDGHEWLYSELNKIYDKLTQIGMQND